MDGGELARRAEVLRPQSLLQQQGAAGGVEGREQHGDLGREVAGCFPQSVRLSDRGGQEIQCALKMIIFQFKSKRNKDINVKCILLFDSVSAFGQYLNKGVLKIKPVNLTVSSVK